ncbi:hypothetical protein DBB36_09395 [Flavobacterium sp. WLB]|nr:hypothetical protein AKO67_10610 [Flavobacterium sp. VMW]OWU92224.1 hypothetical protein APR43_03030 [Flavobacterium sp. NLM]PUU70305.1 hypothetical protein DBB36_09395 [Flavobacterium sp. WLB]
MYHGFLHFLSYLNSCFILLISNIKCYSNLLIFKQLNLTFFLIVYYIFFSFFKRQRFRGAKAFYWNGILDIDNSIDKDFP